MSKEERQENSPLLADINSSNNAHSQDPDFSVFVSAMTAMRSDAPAYNGTHREDDSPVICTKDDVILEEEGHPGTVRFYQMIRTTTAAVSLQETQSVALLVDKVLEGIAAANGRFLIRDNNNYYVMHEDYRNHQVTRTLLDAEQVVIHQQQNGDGKRRPSETSLLESQQPRKKQATTTDTIEVGGVLNPQDVLGEMGGNLCQHSNPGNVLFRQLVSHHVENFRRGSPKEQDEVVNLIIDTVEQQHGGRFLSPDNQHVLTPAQKKAKTWVALNNGVPTSLTTTPSASTNATATTMMSTIAFAEDDDVGEGPRKTDVLGGLGRLKDNPGNQLFRDLISMHVQEYAETGTSSTVIQRILAAIHNQNPPGRLLSSNNQIVLTTSQARNKVRLALHNKLLKIKQGAGGPTATSTNSTTAKARSHSSPALPPQPILSATREADEVSVEGDPSPADVWGEMSNNSSTMIHNNPGNVLFRELVQENKAKFAVHDNDDAIIESIVQAVSNAGGRFLSPNNDFVLNVQKTNAKVWVALHREAAEGNHNNNSINNQADASMTTTSTVPTVISLGSDEENAQRLMPAVNAWYEV